MPQPLQMFQPNLPARSLINQQLTTATRPFHMMTKPIGPICNLDCKYCFYLEKEKLYPDQRKWAMSDGVLEEYIRQYIAAQPLQEVSFAWQGGEPTLLGVRFFRRVVELQKKHAGGKTITNALQTNGTLLDHEWCAFLRDEKFLVGLSIDGPDELNDAYRVDKQGKGSAKDVRRGLKLLRDYSVEFNTLCVLNRKNAAEPLRVYRFLREMGSGFIQFIPLVERAAGPQAKQMGLDLELPPMVGEPEVEAEVTEWSVLPEQFGEFMCTVFDEWVKRDVGRVFVQMFDVTLGAFVGAPPSLCVFAPTCGSAMAVEHNGDVYSCDHYVYPAWKLGNLMETQLAQLAESPFQQKFGQDKQTTLPKYCRECEVKFACQGECPKHRFIRTPDGEPGLNYLCAGYKRFFNHVTPKMRRMAELLRAGRAPAEVMGEGG